MTAPSKMPSCPTDPNSFANTHQVIVKHLALEWTADFVSSTLSGNVKLTLSAVDGTKPEFVVLDTSFLDIQSVQDASGTDLKFELGERDEKFGSPLKVFLPASFESQGLVTIKYSTTKQCTAIQWLEPSQTVGKIYPYLFTQCQAIHARSLVPCQDTPGVKLTYSAKVFTPKPLRALMSAIQTNEDVQGEYNVYEFEQKCTIPSYLIALAVGNLAGERVGPRSTVWSEPEVVKAAAWEFADTESFIKTGEDLLTPYEWGVYDLLLLPASFPYGGMENPCLTFVTPTLLAGDRSLVDVVAHEIAHSWMGNLVTTKNWEHFWLNEGFTVFIERKIAGRLHGEPVRHFNSIIGLKALKESIDHFKEIKQPEYTCLCVKLCGRDPDDAFSSVPYEKGFNFLFYLEQLLGGAATFEPYLKAHVTNFAHTSITTDDFKSFIFEFYTTFEGGSKLKLLESVDWESWLHAPGELIVDNKFDKSLAVKCENLANKWDDERTTGKPHDAPASEFESFTSNQKVMFLERLLLKDPFPTSILQKMDEQYKLTAVQNAEVRFRWQWLCLKGEYEFIFPHVVKFITEVGRMKFVRPLYRALNKCKNGSDLAKSTFLANKNFYHPICAAMVSKDLGLTA